MTNKSSDPTPREVAYKLVVRPIARISAVAFVLLTTAFIAFVYMMHQPRYDSNYSDAIRVINGPRQSR